MSKGFLLFSTYGKVSWKNFWSGSSHQYLSSYIC